MKRIPYRHLPVETFLVSDMFMCVRTASVYSRQSSYGIEGTLTHRGSGVPTPGPQLRTAFANVLEALGSKVSLEKNGSWTQACRLYSLPSFLIHFLLPSCKWQPMTKWAPVPSAVPSPPEWNASHSKFLPSELVCERKVGTLPLYGFLSSQLQNFLHSSHKPVPEA